MFLPHGRKHSIKSYSYSVLHHSTRYPKLRCPFNIHKLFGSKCLRWYRELSQQDTVCCSISIWSPAHGIESPMHKYMLGTEKTENSFAEKVLKSYWISWTPVSSMPLCWTKAVAPRAALARPYPAKEVITFGTWETMSGILSTFGLPHTIKIDVLEQVQWAVTEMITVGAQQHMRMHWSTSLVSIKSRWCGRRKPDSCLYLLWGYKEKGTRLQH